MPLYKDIHTDGSEKFSVQDVINDHMEDLSIQERLGLNHWDNIQKT